MANSSSRASLQTTDTLHLSLFRRVVLHLEGDRIFGLAAVLFAFGVVVLLTSPSLDAQVTAEMFLGVGFNLLAVFGALKGVRALQPRERRFWRLVALSFGIWGAVFVSFLLLPDQAWSLKADMATDVAYLLFYLAFLSAVESRPDLKEDSRPVRLQMRFRFPGAAVFAVGLFLFFIGIPSVVDPEIYAEYWWPSFFFYLSMDLFLTGRLTLLARATRSDRWQFIYRVLAVTWMALALSDANEWLSILDNLPTGWGKLLSPLWMVPSMIAIAAIRLRSLPAEDVRQEAKRDLPRVELTSVGAPFFAYALILPLLYLALYRLGFFRQSTEIAHEIFLVVWMVVLGTVSLVQHLQVIEHTKKLEGERELTEERLWYLANYDAVTDLPNRVLFESRLERALVRARREKRMLAVAFVDLDDFKRVNDSFGHRLGDRVLRSVGERLTAVVREGDTVARFGGDEFTIVLEGLAEAAAADRMMRRVAASLSQPFVMEGREVVIRASIGVGVYPQDGEDGESLLGNADAAMYQGKKGKGSGHDNVQFFAEERHGEIRDRLQRETDLREGITRGELLLHYQPKWTVDGRQLTGVEALIRWQHPQRGLLQPKDIIELAERTGLMRQIDRWVMEEACHTLADWRRQGLGDISIAVNVSARQFRDIELPERLAELLESYEIKAQSLELELTETAVMTDRETVKKNLQSLAEMGVGIAIDDFGTGHNSLQFLTYMKPDKLKIAHNFIHRLEQGSASTAVVMAILTLAHELGIRVIAEGVEEESQRQLLEALGCDEIQGYFKGRPQSRESTTELLRRSAGAPGELRR